MRKTDQRGSQGGFTYLMLLIALSVLALSLLKAADGEKMRHIYQQEQELLFRGEQIRMAIASYRDEEISSEKSREKSRNPRTHGCFPVSFAQLLEDKRGRSPRYHLRQLYADPLTQRQEWGMIYDEKKRWIGVHSLGHGKPRRKAGFKSDEEKFAKAQSYAEWTFTVKPDPQAPLPSHCR